MNRQLRDSDGGRRGMRIGPRHPWLGAAGFRLALPRFERFYRRRRIFRSTSAFARARISAIKAKIERGETAYLAGVSASGTHNSGIALVEVTRRDGPRLIFNNEEERFSAVKHTNEYPRRSIEAMQDAMARMGLAIDRIDGWFTSWDYVAFGATLIRTLLEEAPASFSMISGEPTPLFNLRDFDRGTRAARHIGRQLGLSEPVALIGTPHHDNHAWHSFAISPFVHSERLVMVAVLDGLGDMGAISLYVCEGGRMRRLYSNDSVFDSLGIFYAMISSTQGGWTWLSSEGRYMGATAYGNGDRKTNPYYAALKPILSLQPEGRIALNRDLANWPRNGAHGAREAGSQRAHSLGRACRRHRTPADRAREHRSPHLRILENARPTHRRRGRGQHLVQCQRSDCADADAGARYAAPLQGSRYRADGFGRRSGVRGLTCRRGRCWRGEAFPQLARRLASGNWQAHRTLATTPRLRPASARRRRPSAPARPA